VIVCVTSTIVLLFFYKNQIKKTRKSLLGMIGMVALATGLALAVPQQSQGQQPILEEDGGGGAGNFFLYDCRYRDNDGVRRPGKLCETWGGHCYMESSCG
jgi:hypothetical protein